MSDQQIINTLLEFKDYLNLASIWISPLRIIGWYILLGLSMAVDALSGVVTEIYSLINFYDSPSVNDFIDKYMIVIFAIAGVGIAWLGWKIIIQNKTDYNKIVTNIIIAITIFIVLPWGMQQGAKLVTESVTELDSNTSKSVSIFQANITDVYALDKAGWNTTEPTVKNYIKDKTSVELIDILEKVDTGGFLKSSSLSSNGEDILKYQLNDSSGRYQVEELDSNFFVDDKSYYRYDFHFWYMLIELGTLAMVLLFTGFKTAMLIKELGILKTLTMGTVLTDIESGQRNKKLVEKIRNTFIIMYVVMLLLNIYLLFIDFVSKSSISMAAQMVVIMAAGFLVITGPNIFEEIFGIDAGLRNIGQTLMGVTSAAQGVGAMANMVGGVVQGATAVAGGAATIAGQGAVFGTAIGKGVLDGFKEKSASVGSGITSGVSGGGGSIKSGKDKSSTSDLMKKTPFNVMNTDKVMDSISSSSTNSNENNSSSELSENSKVEPSNASQSLDNNISPLSNFEGGAASNGEQGNTDHPRTSNSNEYNQSPLNNYEGSSSAIGTQNANSGIGNTDSSQGMNTSGSKGNSNVTSPLSSYGGQQRQATQSTSTTSPSSQAPKPITATTGLSQTNSGSSNNLSKQSTGNNAGGGITPQNSNSPSNVSKLRSSGFSYGSPSIEALTTVPQNSNASSGTTKGMQINTPSYFNEAQNRLNEAKQTVPTTTQSLGEAVMSAYTDKAKGISNSPTMQKSRKIYDMTRNTINKKDGN